MEALTTHLSGGGGGVEGGKVRKRLFEFGFGLGGVAISLREGRRKYLRPARFVRRVFGPRRL